MCCCVETIYRRVMLYTSKDREKNIFSDDITFNTVSKTSDLLLRKSTNLNNNPRKSFHWIHILFFVVLSPWSLSYSVNHLLSHVMRKPAFCKCENKDADQLRSNCAAPLFSLHG